MPGEEKALKIEKHLYEGLSHSICVSNLAYKIGKELELEENICYELAKAGLLHDIGKIKLSRYLFGDKDDVMTVDELRYVRLHPQLGFAILKNYEYSEFVLESILYHHENIDGSGYPNNLKDSEIPYGAKIIRVCDVFSALITDRPYRSAFDMETAIELMIDEVKNFDMEIFLTFLKVVHEEDIENLLELENNNNHLLRRIHYDYTGT